VPLQEKDPLQAGAGCADGNRHACGSASNDDDIVLVIGQHTKPEWSVGVVEKRETFPAEGFSQVFLPVLQHSNIPLLHSYTTPSLHYSILLSSYQLRSFASFGDGFIGNPSSSAMMDMIFMVQKEPWHRPI